MEKVINENVISVLKLNDDLVIKDYITIKNNFVEELKIFNFFLKKYPNDPDRLFYYIKDTNSLKKLEGFHSYCRNYDAPYQGFNFKLEDIDKIFKNGKERIKESIQKDHSEKIITSRKIELTEKLYNKITICIKAYNIEQAYKICDLNDSIFVYSHRRVGWSNPIYQLSNNFSAEVMTNFGYGSSSYFFVVLRYKNIDITPISEWINYYHADYDDIIRYTRSYTQKHLKMIKNGEKIYKNKIVEDAWESVINFTLKACNCSLRDEEEFVNNYIIDECKKMIEGLNNIFCNSKFELYDDKYEKEYFTIENHNLIEFRGEKISGAIDFITKIIEFDQIINVQKYIDKIGELCQKISPILDDELDIIEEKLKEYQPNLEKIKFLYDGFEPLDKYFRSSIFNFEIEIKKIKLMSQVDDKAVLNEYLKNHPEYEGFNQAFSRIKSEYFGLMKMLRELEKNKKNIIDYNKKIKRYLQRN
ncbi:MAG: hypothetical protein ACTH5N_03650 [Psychroflexus halocasei]